MKSKKRTKGRMKENNIYDKKSLRIVIGKTADFKELAKDCVAFSNAEGGTIDIGIEDKETLPPVGQMIPEELTTTIVNKKCLIEEGKVETIGQNRWTKYRLKKP